MRRTRHVIAVMVVATALCADRSVSAAPQQPRPQGAARSLASRITGSFRHVVAPVRVVAVRSEEKPESMPLPVRHAASGVRSELSPFQFRLPPPMR